MLLTLWLMWKDQYNMDEIEYAVDSANIFFVQIYGIQWLF